MVYAILQRRAHQNIQRMSQNESGSMIGFISSELRYGDDSKSEFPPTSVSSQPLFIHVSAQDAREPYVGDESKSLPMVSSTAYNYFRQLSPVRLTPSRLVVSPY
ncbi:hypothetical protein AcW1_003352 [Taiwanofungus camphoratus]|nr:hypothetical protein AcV5_002184 [Antrodia cinnamomea]KAI0941471.1 hypothetical protein AcW1_003352 [Antrodia cinnamomea]